MDVGGLQRDECCCGIALEAARFHVGVVAWQDGRRSNEANSRGGFFPGSVRCHVEAPEGCGSGMKSWERPLNSSFQHLPTTSASESNCRN